MTHQGVVLIVDDDRLNRTLLTRNVTKAGYVVETASGGEEALTILAKKPIDVILLDLLMPDMDGYEVLSHIKGNDSLHHIPVIVISNIKEMQTIVECIKLGATDHLPKPVNPLLLQARLNASLATKRLHDAKAAYTNELRLQNEELDAFTQTVAHDLKVPLTAVIGYCELLIDMDDETLLANRHRLNKVTHVARNMENIIHELLLLAHVRQEEIEGQAIDMGAVLQAAQQRLAYLIQKHQPQMHFPQQWPSSIGYAPWLEEVWANYISNALKYGGKPPQLQFGADLDTANNKVRFWLQDNGNGISATDQLNLFLPFKRLSQVRTEGQGLGLSIVQRIIDKLGGEVGVDSQINKGSTFWFTLPSR